MRDTGGMVRAIVKSRSDCSPAQCPPTAELDQRPTREERLAEALRINLRRRKEQARARAERAPGNTGKKPPEP